MNLTRVRLMFSNVQNPDGPNKINLRQVTGYVTQFWDVPSISGDYVIVGATDWESAKGTAYIFKRSGDSWEQKAQLLANDRNFADNFGMSVSIDGDYAIISSPSDDDKGNGSGSVYVFKRDTDAETWTYKAKLTAGDGGKMTISAKSVPIG